MVVIIGLTITVELITLAQAGFPAGGCASLTLVAAGVATSYRRPYTGLLVVATAPLVAAVTGWTTTATWSIACFSALVCTLRGLPGLPVALLVATANLVAVGLPEGTVLPSQNPWASIAAAWALIMSAAGSAIYGHRRYWFELERRTREALSTRESAVRRSVAEERVRIARDLHDSVGHRIAVLSMHLGSAEVHLPEGAEGARADLVAARTDVQSVLAEIQQILRILRDGTDASSLAPTAQHGRIPDLVASFRAAGVAIEASLPDLSHPLPPHISAAAFRITQEALTNAHRHGTGPVSLRLGISDDGTLTIEVVNLRRPTSTAQAGSVENRVVGNGLVGMRERALSAGGHVEARADGRLFWVRAELPAEGPICQ